VKTIYGGVIDIILNKRNIEDSKRYFYDSIKNLLDGKVDINELIISKTIKTEYSNPNQIAHKVLGDRMGDRDPGNKPQVGDRIPYVYVSGRKDEKKQGDRIEHYDYVKEKNLKPDVEFYISNQIQNPLAQMFALAIDQLDGYKSKTNYTAMLKEYMEDGMDEEDATLAVLKQKEKELDSLLFLGSQYLSKHKRGPMDAFLGRK
jgi:DNA polymerase elongation subunit (family B)